MKNQLIFDAVHGFVNSLSTNSEYGGPGIENIKLENLHENILGERTWIVKTTRIEYQSE